MDKASLINAFLALLQEELELLTRAAMMARDEATNEESKAENKYDTRGQEAAYLAESQAKMAVELQASIALYRTLDLRPFTSQQAVDAGAVVELRNGESSSYFFLGPRNGGLEAQLDGKAVTLVTPQSPLGRQLMGKRVGDTVLVPGRGRQVPHTIHHLS